MSWSKHDYALKQLEIKEKAQAVRRDENEKRRNREATDRFNEAFQPQLEKFKETVVRTDVQEARLKERANKALEKEQNIAEADGITRAYEEIYNEVDEILVSALYADNSFDPIDLCISPQHPPFNPGMIGRPIPEPSLMIYPREPIYVEPKTPSFLAKMFGLSKNHKEEVERAKAAWVEEYRKWQEYTSEEIPARNKELKERHINQEAERKEKLRRLEEEYQSECLKREEIVNSYNRDVEDFVQALNEGDSLAVEEYKRIIFARSVFPDCFTVERECNYNGEDKELEVTVFVPEPDSIPIVKSARYIASRGEIQYSDLAIGAQKNRYNNAVYSTALRTIYEVYRADSRHLIETISLTIQVQTIDPATGHSVVNPLALVACERGQFADLNLENVEPLAALKGLRAILSKNPFESIPAIVSEVEVRR